MHHTQRALALAGVAAALLAGGLAPRAHAAIIDFESIATGTYNATTTGSAWDFTTTASDGTAYGFRSAKSNYSDDATIVETKTDGHAARMGNWGGKLYFGRVDGGTFSLQSLDAKFVGTGQVFDATVTGMLNTVATGTQDVSGNDAFQTYTFGSDFSNVDVVIFDVAGGVNERYADVDNINLTANAVPEPASLALLASGGLLLLRRRRA